jgi:hypothetical protein
MDSDTKRKILVELNKLPKPSNKGLKELFVDVNKIVIKAIGIFEKRVTYDTILLTISFPDKIGAIMQKKFLCFLYLKTKTKPNVCGVGY